MSLILSIWAVGRHPSAAFFLAPSRVFELLIGTLVARTSLPSHVSQIQRDLLSIAGLALLLVSIVAFNDLTPFPGFAALVPCCGTALIILAGTDRPSLAGRIIGASAVAIFFGDISYSLYLWHWPFLVFGRYFFAAPLSLLQASILILASVCLARLSWLFVERPFLAWRGRPSAVLAFGASSMMVGCAAAGALALSNGLPSRFAPETLRLFASANDYNHRRAECHNPDNREIPYEKNCLYGDPSAAPMAAVWGDSHGVELVMALRSLTGRPYRRVSPVSSRVSRRPARQSSLCIKYRFSPSTHRLGLAYPVYMGVRSMTMESPTRISAIKCFVPRHSWISWRIAPMRSFSNQTAYCATKMCVIATQRLSAVSTSTLITSAWLERGCWLRASPWKSLRDLPSSG
jgi:hypothetical protein